MSLCITLQTPEMVLIGADSRESLNLNGTYFTTLKNKDKIHNIDGAIIFCSGSGIVTDRIISEYKSSPIKSVHYLQVIAKKHVKQFIDKYGEDYLGKSRHAELIYVCFENNKSVVYNISSNNNCGIQRFESDSNGNTITLGVYTDESLEMVNQLQNIMHPIEMYKHIYNSLACEQLGGILTIYVLNKSGIIRFEQHEIIDHKHLNVVAFEDEVSNRSYNATDGIKIQSNIGTPSNPIWDDRFYVDTNGNLTAEQLMTNKLVVKNGNDVLIDANTRIIDFSKFTTKLGTINAANIDATNLHVKAANIDGTITANSLIANATITSPNINGGNIVGTNITGTSTITGATIQTGSSGNYIRLASGLNRLSFWQDNQEAFAIQPTSSGTNLWDFTGQGVKTRAGDNWYFPSNNYFSGYTSFSAGVNFSSAAVSGLSVNKIDGLQSSLDAKATKGVQTGGSNVLNGGIPIGTVLRTADGGTVTWNGIGSHTHTQN